ncbi:hypothetical protein KAH81_01800 [bacterium]|nr:hypothetical protein [bacterium]
MEDCQCAGPVPTAVSPLPCGVWSACDYQQVVIEFVDDDVGTNPATIQIMVDSVLYSYPTYMTWTPISTTVGRLTFTPPTPWTHGECVDYWVVRADDWNGCPKTGDAYCWFCMDLEPPEEVDWTPDCGIFLDDTILDVSISIQDFESGINILGLSFTVNGVTYPLGAGPPTVDFTGSASSGTASLYGTFGTLDLHTADSAVVCLNTCDQVSSSWCGPNCEQYCCVFYLNQPPEAEFVHPDPEIFTSCDPEFISMHFWDDVGADVDPSTAVLEINGTSYPAGHTWMDVTTDSLIFTPTAGFFEDGDTVSACLISLADGAGASVEDLPLCLTFYIDYSPPEPLSWSPRCETFIDDTILDLSVTFQDLGSGIDDSEFSVTINGTSYSLGSGPPAISYSGDTVTGVLSILGTFRQLDLLYEDSIEVCITTCDRVTDEYCGPNCEEYCCSFPINLPPEAEFVYPDSFIYSACEPQPFSLHLWDPAGAPVDPYSALIEVNGITYDITSPMVEVTCESLIFTPDPAIFVDGDTIEACLNYLADSAGAEMDSLPICLIYYLDYSPPASVGWSPECETFLPDSFLDIWINLEDLGAGIDTASAIIEIGGYPHYLGDIRPPISYMGDEDSGSVVINGRISYLGLDDPDSFDVCLTICDLVTPVYCGANCTTYCCRYFVNRPPDAEFVYPDSGTWSACDPQPIALHIWDDAGAGIDPSSVILDINRVPYDIGHAWLTVTSDSIIFSPAAGFFHDGEVVYVCLRALADSAGAIMADLPICRTFMIDYSTPVVTGIFPPSDTTVMILPDSISFDLFDSLSGLGAYGIHLTVQGTPIPWTGGFTEPDSLFHVGFHIDGSICLGASELCTVEVCVQAPDLPDYCDPNVLDTCWSWYFERSGPVPSIVFPMPNTISACEDSGIIIRIDSTLAAVDSLSIVLTITKLGLPTETYTCADDELIWLADSSILWFDPDIGYWVDADTVEVCLDSCDDIFTTPSPGIPLCWEFYTDFTPPVFWAPLPPPDTMINDISPRISIFVFDSISGVSVLDLITTISVNGAPADSYAMGMGVEWNDSTGEYYLDPTILGIAFADSDTVEICVYAEDQPDYCGPNWGEFCWRFIVSLSGPVPEWVQYAPNSWVACDSTEQFAVATLIDPDGVVPSSIVITVDGDSFAVGTDSEVGYVNDTLTFTPSGTSGYWRDLDTVEFCVVEAADSLGNTMGAPYCWSWLMDLTPPVFWDELPLTGSLLADSLAPFSVHVYDSLSGLDIDCFVLSIDDSIIMHRGDPGVTYDTLSSVFAVDPPSAGLVWGDWDTVDVCLSACDLPDYCGPNTAEYCWWFEVHLMGPIAEIVTPQLGEITSCYDQCITIILSDDDVGVDPSTIMMVVEGDTYYVDDSIVTYTETALETTLTFCPIPAGMAWIDSQLVHVELISADDTLGNPLQTPLLWTFWVDLEAPVVENFSSGGITPVCGDTVFTTRPIVSFDLWDNLSGVDTSRLEITIDDTMIYHWGDPGITAAGGVFTVATGALVPSPSYRGGDSVYICVYVEDTTDICADNVATYCCRFYVMPGGPSPTIFRPLPYTWSACIDTEHIDIEIYDSDGTVDSSIIVSVTRSASGPLPGTTMLYYDSPGVVWADPNFSYNPPISFADPETVHVCIEQAWDPVFNPMSPESLCWTFMMDQTPPLVSGALPVAGAVEATRHPTVEFDLADIQSGLDASSIELTITGSLVGTSIYDLTSTSVIWSIGHLSWDPSAAGIAFTGGESVDVCVYAYDSPDYCSYNELDTCWSFSIEPGGPLAEIMRVYEDSISACDPEYIIIRLWDDDDVVDSTISLEVDGAVYDYPDHMSYDHATDILRFDPVPPFDPVDIIGVRLLAAEDSLGNPLDSSAFLDWTFYVDRVSPIAFGESPSGDIHMTSPLFYVNLWDTLAGINPDSIILTIDGVDYYVGDAGVSWMPSGLGGALEFDPSAAVPPVIWHGGDTVDWCVYVVDFADDYSDDDGCLPNVLDTCWRFAVVPGGPVGQILYPREGWFVACDPDSIIMLLSDTEDDALFEDSIEVIVARSAWGLGDTLTYLVDSTELSYDPLTGGLWYNPDPPFADAETVFIAITDAMDTLFNGLEDGDSLVFYLDYSPPYIISQVPAEYAIVTDIYQDICVGLRDNMSGIDPASLELTVNGTVYRDGDAGVSWDGEDICLTPEDIGLRFWGGDTVDVCIASYDSPDTCGPNAMDSCWRFFVEPGGPVSDVVNPGDSSISACDPEFISMTITDANGVDDTTIQIIVWRSGPSMPPDSTFYTTAHADLDWSEPNLSIQPSVPFADAETVHVCLVRASDVLGNELENPVCWDFFMDLSVYTAWGFEPIPGDTVRTRLPVIRAAVLDTISGLDFASFEVSINGAVYGLYDDPCVNFDELTGEIVIDPSDCGMIFSGGDLVEIRLWGEDTPTDIRDCPANDTTYIWEFFVAPGGPRAEIVTPEPGWYCACDPQGIVIRLWDEDGVDESTIELVVESVTYGVDSPQLTYYPVDSILYFEPSPNFADGQVVDVALVAADDMLANPLETPLSWQFIMDLAAPSISFTEPLTYMTRNRQQPVSFTLTDDGSGIDESSFDLLIYGAHYGYSQVDWNVRSTGSGGEIRAVEVTFYPTGQGIEFVSGDTVDALVSLCDSPDTCGPNCSADSIEFLVEPEIECLVFPNPFTPNGDAINDYTIFNYPYMFSETAELVIFTTRNVEVFRRWIDVRELDLINVVERSWDGQDMKGRFVTEGLYIYIIIQNGQIICNGTVVIAR